MKTAPLHSMYISIAHGIQRGMQRARAISQPRLALPAGLVPSETDVQQRIQSRDVSSVRYLWLSVCTGISVGCYFVLRYSGYWGEIDSGLFIQMIDWFIDSERIIHPGNYKHGYAYSVWAGNLSSFLGLSVPQLSRLYTPIIGNLFLGAFGFVAFRHWLGSHRLGMLAASALFLVPELVFTMSRGNHEKLTVSLTLLASLTMLKSFSESRERPGVAAAWVLIHYLTTFVLVSLNAFFGSMFIFAISIVFGAAMLILTLAYKARHTLLPIVRQLGFMVIVSWLIMSLVNWYVYPHEGHTANLLERVFDGFYAVHSSGEATSDPYAMVRYDWVSREVYHLISSFRYILFAVSFVTWLVLFVITLATLKRVQLARLLLVALYGAFSMLLALGVAIDFLGLDAGSNWQVRIFTYFSSFAVPFFVLGIASITQLLLRFLPRRVVLYPLATLMVGLAVLSLMKATLDPLVSNRWIGYKPTEVRAMDFWFTRREPSRLNISMHNRLIFSYVMHYGWRPGFRGYIEMSNVPQAPHIVRSTVSRANSLAWGTPETPLLLENPIYDNGETQIIHRRPRTPFQQ